MQVNCIFSFGTQQISRLTYHSVFKYNYVYSEMQKGKMLYWNTKVSLLILYRRSYIEVVNISSILLHTKSIVHTKFTVRRTINNNQMTNVL